MCADLIENGATASPKFLGGTEPKQIQQQQEQGSVVWAYLIAVILRHEFFITIKSA